jgi:hypothetical protein
MFETEHWLLRLIRLTLRNTLWQVQICWPLKIYVWTKGPTNVCSDTSWMYRIKSDERKKKYINGQPKATTSCCLFALTQKIANKSVGLRAHRGFYLCVRWMVCSPYTVHTRCLRFRTVDRLPLDETQHLRIKYKIEFKTNITHIASLFSFQN